MANWSPPPRWLLAVLKKRWSWSLTKCKYEKENEFQNDDGSVAAIGNAWYRLYFFAFVRTRWSRVPMSWRYTVDEEHFWIYFRPIERFRPSTQTDLSSEERRGGEREREMASGSEREEQSGAREIRRTEAEEARENLERCFKSKEKGNGLIIMLSTALFN